ncbi:hypothetical protein COOONC_26257 [Cooperia oncophora]
MLLPPYVSWTAWLTFEMAFDRQVVIPLDESHELCGRVMGALFVTSYTVSAHALHWTDKKDRIVAVDARVVCCICILSAQVWSQIAYLESWSGGHWVGITLFSTWTADSITISSSSLPFWTKTKTI